MSNYAVTCYGPCGALVWQGDDLVTEDGQELLTAFADVACHEASCPHRTTAIEAAAVPDPLALIEALQARLAELEGKNTASEPR